MCVSSPVTCPPASRLTGCLGVQVCGARQVLRSDSLLILLSQPLENFIIFDPLFFLLLHSRILTPFFIDRYWLFLLGSLFFYFYSFFRYLFIYVLFIFCCLYLLFMSCDFFLHSRLFIFFFIDCPRKILSLFISFYCLFYIAVSVYIFSLLTFSLFILFSSLLDFILYLYLLTVFWFLFILQFSFINYRLQILPLYVFSYPLTSITLRSLLIFILLFIYLLFLCFSRIVQHLWPFPLNGNFHCFLANFK